jgi:hypothetical protein
MQGNETYDVRIIEPCRFVPENGKRETLPIGEVRAMAGEDAFNVVASGRGVFVNPDSVPNELKGKK